MLGQVSPQLHIKDFGIISSWGILQVEGFSGLSDVVGAEGFFLV